MVAIQHQLAHELLAGGAPVLEVTVVFRRPLNQADFERLADAALLGRRQVLVHRTSLK